MRPRFLRALPSLLAAALLALVARAQTPGAVARSSTHNRAQEMAAQRAPVRSSLRAPAEQIQLATCPTTQTYSPALDFFGAPPGSGGVELIQPLSVTVSANYGAVLAGLSQLASVRLEVILVDALTGQPVAGTAPLSSRVVDGSEILPELPFNETRPIVADPLSPFAEPSGLRVALRVVISDPSGNVRVGYDPNGPSSVPTATALLDSGVPVTLGPHAVMAHSYCPQANEPYVVGPSQVTYTALTIPGSVSTLMQEFSTAVTVTARWVELVRHDGTIPDPTSPTAGLAIERVVTPGPPDAIWLPTATATRLGADAGSPPAGGAVWVASDMFAMPAVLVPGQLYRLRVSFRDGLLPLGIDDSGGDAAPGILWEQSSPDAPWVARSDADLAFRIIGLAGNQPPPPAAECAAGSILDRTQPTESAAIVLGIGGGAAQLLREAGMRPVGGVQIWTPPGGPTVTAELRASAVTGVVREDTYPFETFTPTTLPPGVPYDEPSRTTSRPIVTRGVTINSGGPDSDDDGLAVVVTGGSPAEPAFLVAWGDDPTFNPNLFTRGPAGWELSSESRSMVCQVCGATDLDGDDGSDLRVVSGRLRVVDPPPATNYVPTSTPAFSVLQRFRVAVTTTADWVELAIPGEGADFPDAPIHLVNLQGIDPPPPGVIGLASIASTILLPRSVTVTAGEWRAAQRFPGGTLLEADHDYGLAVVTQYQWRPGEDVVTVSAEAYYTQPSPSGPWIEDLTRRLSFRLIGVPVPAPLGVGPAAPGAAAFSLRLGPNPAGDHVSLAWSGGGSGRVRLEILDVRGRLVRRVRDAGVAAAGQWRWDGRDERGNSVAAGVYFARVTGVDGRVASRQVVRIR